MATSSRAAPGGAVFLQSRRLAENRCFPRKSKRRRTGVVKLGIEHVLSKRLRRLLEFRWREREQSHDISLRLGGKHVEVRLDHCVSLLARHPLGTRNRDSCPSVRRLLA